jgi:hypothetical protein
MRNTSKGWTWRDDVAEIVPLLLLGATVALTIGGLCGALNVAGRLAGL